MRGTKGNKRYFYVLVLPLLAVLLFLAGPKRAMANGTLTATFLDSSQFNGPAGVTVDSSGNVWVADRNNHRVVSFNPSNPAGTSVTYGTPGSFGTPGSGTYQFNCPRNVAVDPSGNVWVADACNGHIAEFTPGAPNGSTGTFASWKTFGSPGTGVGQFGWPDGVAFYNGNVYIADQANDRIVEFNPSNFLGTWTTYGGSGVLGSLGGVAVDASGDIWTADYTNNRIAEYVSGAGTWNYYTGFNYCHHQSGSTTCTGYTFSAPTDVAVDSSGNIWVTEAGNNDRVDELYGTGLVPGGAASGGDLWGGPGSGSGAFNYPVGMALDSSGNVWVADYNNNRIDEFDLTLQSNSDSTWIGFGFFNTYGTDYLWLDDAYVYLQDQGTLNMLKYFSPAAYILGPSDPNGNISVSVPDGTYHAMIMRRAQIANATGVQYGPPMTGDYIWTGTITVADGSAINLGDIQAQPFGQEATISGTLVPCASGSVYRGQQTCQTLGSGTLQNYFVFADPGECGPYNYGVAQCSDMAPASAPTDANGNFTIHLRAPGYYYIYATPYPEEPAQYMINALNNNPYSISWSGNYYGPRLIGQVSVGAGQQANMGEGGY